jgi:hypothetical protein
MLQAQKCWMRTALSWLAVTGAVFCFGGCAGANNAGPVPDAGNGGSFGSQSLPTSSGGGSGGAGGTGGARGVGAAGATGMGGAAPTVTLPAPVCQPAPGGGQGSSAAPILRRTLAGGGAEAWLGSPAIADLDGDGQREIVAARGSEVVVWSTDGKLRGSHRLPGSRIWAAPLVGNFVGDGKLEIVVACRGTLTMLDASLRPLPGFPLTWRDELRSLAAADLDADGQLEIVVGTTSDLVAGGNLRDILAVFRGDGTMQKGFPPNTTGTSGCDTACYTHAGFDQNIALGPLDGQAGDDIFLPQDNACSSPSGARCWASVFSTTTRRPNKATRTTRKIRCRPTSPTRPPQSPTSTAMAKTSS